MGTSVVLDPNASPLVQAATICRFHGQPWMGINTCDFGRIDPTHRLDTWHFRMEGHELGSASNDHKARR